MTPPEHFVQSGSVPVGRDWPLRYAHGAAVPICRAYHAGLPGRFGNEHRDGAAPLWPLNPALLVRWTDRKGPIALIGGLCRRAVADDPSDLTAPMICRQTRYMAVEPVRRSESRNLPMPILWEAAGDKILQPLWDTRPRLSLYRRVRFAMPS